MTHDKMNTPAPLVYLSGPITGLSYGQSTDWRAKFTEDMYSHNIQCMSPMRHKEYLSQETQIKDGYNDRKLPLSCDRGITTRDYNDVKRAHLLFANLLGTTKISIGTVMEIAWAKALQIPVVVAIEDKGNPHDHCMIRECIGFRVNNLEEGVHVVKSVLSYE